MKKNVLNFRRIIKRLKNGDHAALNEAISKRAALDAAKIGNGTLSIRVAAYKAACDWEDEAMKPERAAAQTPLVHEADRDRDEDITYIETIVSGTAEYKKIPERQAAAQLLQRTLVNYKNVKDKNLTDETGLVSNMLEDFDKPDNHAALETLGLLPAVENLRSSNNRFKEYWDERALSAEAKRQHGTMKIARADADDHLSELTEFIDALYNSELLADEAQKTLGELIDFINAQVSAYDNVLAHRHRKKDKEAEAKS